MRRLLFGATIIATMLSSSALMAQYDSYFHVSPYSVPLSETQPQRPVILAPNQSDVYTGLAMDMSKDQVGKGWVIPLGGSFGLTPGLEIGLHSALLLDSPGVNVYGYNVLNRLQLFGRYVVLQDHVAAELAIDVPTFSTATLGISLNVPVRYWMGPLDLLGRFHLNFDDRPGIATTDAAKDLVIGLDATALYTIVDKLFVGLDTGFSVLNLDGLEDNIVVPIGIGVGYRVLPNSFLKLMFMFPDIASKDAADEFNGTDARVLMLTWVQAIDISRKCESGLEASAPPPPPAPESPAPPAAPEGGDSGFE